MGFYGNPVERREDERLAVNLDVLVHPYRAAPFVCLMHDICGGGALLSLYDDCTLAPGDEVLVEGADMEMVSTVAWVVDGACGVRFHRRLHAHEVAALRMIEREQIPQAPHLPPAYVIGATR